MQGARASSGRRLVLVRAKAMVTGSCAARVRSKGKGGGLLRSVALVCSEDKGGGLLRGAA
jgi:hypothetical protein